VVGGGFPLEDGGFEAVQGCVGGTEAAEFHQVGVGGKVAEEVIIDLLGGGEGGWYGGVDGGDVIFVRDVVSGDFVEGWCVRVIFIVVAF